MVLEKLNIHVPKNEVGSFPYNIYENNSKWIKYLNIKLATIKLPEDNIWEKLHDVGFEN